MMRNHETRVRTPGQGPRDFVRNVVGKARVAAAAVVCRAANGFPLPNGFRALPVTELR
jgi:hypothetical protein